MAICGHWQMCEIVICVYHQKLLVPLWKARQPMTEAT